MVFEFLANMKHQRTETGRVLTTNRRKWVPMQNPATTGRRRGSALLLSMAVTILLFIVGFAFLLNTQTQKLTVTNITTRSTLDEGVDAVVKYINTVLVQDLFGNDNNLLNGDAGDEYHDYPGPDDPWLASLEPEFFNDGTSSFYFWRHITDLWGNNFGVPAAPFYMDPDNKDVPNQMAFANDSEVSWHYWVFNTDTSSLPLPLGLQRPYKATVAAIVNENASIPFVSKDPLGDPTFPNQLSWGSRADADGDGVADSRWVIIPGIKGPGGEDIYAAIRVIDNGGMINVNTAYRFPNPAVVTTGTPQWDGSQLSHVNLEGIKATLDPTTVQDFQAVRYGTISPASPSNYTNDTRYEAEFALRTLNPKISTAGEFYGPFDVTDELELRNRYLLTSLNYTQIESTAWPLTFDPGPWPGYPYLPGNTVVETQNRLDGWFQAVTCGWKPSNLTVVNYNRRHISTTYNFDRVIVPRLWPSSEAMPSDLEDAWEAWTQWDEPSLGPREPHPLWSYRPAPINDIVRAVTELDPSDFIAGSTEIAGVTVDPIELLAAAIWLGLPENDTITDNDQFKDQTGLDWQDDTRERLAYQMAVNLIDYVDEDDFVTVYPDPSTGGDEYYGFESKAERLYIATLAVSYTDGEDHYAIQLYNHGPENIDDLSRWKIEVKSIGASSAILYDLPANSIAPEESIILIDEDTPSGFTETEFDDVVDIFATGSFRFTNGDRVVLLGPHSNPVVEGERPVDLVEVLEMPETGPPTGREVTHTDEREVKILDFPPDDELLAMELEPTWGTAELDVDAFDEPVVISSSDTAVANIQVKSRNDPDNELTTLGEFYNVLAIGPMKFNNIYSATTENWYRLLDDDAIEDVEEKVEQGRLEIGNGDFAGAVRYLTVFNPFNDFDVPVDPIDFEDPQWWQSNPIDNDGDGFPNVPQELAIAGRININTAPWFVIAQLPWIQEQAMAPEDQYKLAHAIAAYRDKTDLRDILNDAPAPNYAGGRENGMGATDPVREEPGFANITELVNVTQDLAAFPEAAAPDPFYDIRRLGRDGEALAGGPDYTPDNADDDMEERDMLFHRVSNLATVRSDVFTAYILVRLGRGGPQKRVIGIFDRSQVYSPADMPKLVALHPVPDPN